MKKIFLLLIMTWILPGVAQEGGGKVFRMLPALGLNGGQIHGDGYNGYDKFGLFAGAAVEMQPSERVALQMGFYFSQKGSKHNPNPKNNDYTVFKVQLNCLDLAFTLDYYLNEKFYLSVGPYLAYLISYNVELNGSNMNDQHRFNRYELGLNTGLGRKFNQRLSAEVRFTNSVQPILPYGLNANVYSNNIVARYFNKGLYNNVLTLFISYRLGREKHGTEN